eukprot:364639-Chlamydomonas_euryale.AAC.17
MVFPMCFMLSSCCTSELAQLCHAMRATQEAGPVANLATRCCTAIHCITLRGASPHVAGQYVVRLRFESVWQSTGAL